MTAPRLLYAQVQCQSCGTQITLQFELVLTTRDELEYRAELPTSCCSNVRIKALQEAAP